MNAVHVPAKIVYDMTRDSKNQNLVRSGQAIRQEDLQGDYVADELSEDELFAVRKEFAKK